MYGRERLGDDVRPETEPSRELSVWLEETLFALSTNDDCGQTDAAVARLLEAKSSDRPRLAAWVSLRQIKLAFDRRWTKVLEVLTRWFGARCAMWTEAAFSIPARTDDCFLRDLGSDQILWKSRTRPSLEPHTWCTTPQSARWVCYLGEGWVLGDLPDVLREADSFQGNPWDFLSSFLDNDDADPKEPPSKKSCRVDPAIQLDRLVHTWTIWDALKIHCNPTFGDVRRRTTTSLAAEIFVRSELLWLACEFYSFLKPEFQRVVGAVLHQMPSLRVADTLIGLCSRVVYKQGPFSPVASALPKELFDLAFRTDTRTETFTRDAWALKSEHFARQVRHTVATRCSLCVCANGLGWRSSEGIQSYPIENVIRIARIRRWNLWRGLFRAIGVLRAWLARVRWARSSNRQRRRINENDH